jgi:hypothetical protein
MPGNAITNKEGNVKRILSLLFVAIATLAIVTSAVVPHHHHREIPCFTTFHHDATENNCDNYCVMESEYVASFDYTYLFPVVLCVLIDFFPHDTDVKQEYAEYISFYKSADISRSNGLRAPPCYLS